MGAASLSPVWLAVAVPWAGAALIAALAQRPVFVDVAVAVASSAAAVASVVLRGDAARPDALGSALLLVGAASALLAAVADAAARRGAADGPQRFVAAGFPLLQGAQALALLASDPAVAWIGLALGVGAGAALVALGGGRRAFAAAWRMVLLCGAGLALALLGVVLARVRGVSGSPGLSGLGFVLVLLGYGALAGLAPLNTWLPRAVAVSAPPVAAALAGSLLPTALYALFRAAAAVGPLPVGVPPAALLVAVGLATALLAAVAAWRVPGRSATVVPGWGAAGLAGLAAVGFGLGGAAGDLAGVLLLLGLPFSVGAAVLGAAAGGPVAALGRVSFAAVPPFAPFVALVLLFSAAAALPVALALPLGAALLAAAAAQLGALAKRRGGASPAAGVEAGRGGLLVAGPPWVLLGLALALGAALPERVAAALAEAARLVR